MRPFTLLNPHLSVDRLYSLTMMMETRKTEELDLRDLANHGQSLRVTVARFSGSMWNSRIFERKGSRR